MNDFEYEKKLDEITRKNSSVNKGCNIAECLAFFAVVALLNDIIHSDTNKNFLHWFLFAVLILVAAAAVFRMSMIVCTGGDCFNPLAAILNSKRKKEYAKIEKALEAERSQENEKDDERSVT